MKRSLVAIALAGMFLSSAIAFASGTKESSPAGAPTKSKYILNVGTVLTVNDPTYKGLQKFQEEVKSGTNGAVKVNLFPNSQLGTTQSVIEQARVGNAVGIVADPGPLAEFVKDFGIFAGPYLVSSPQQALELDQLPIYKKLAQKLTKVGLKVLSFNYFQGTRYLWTNKPVRNPQDLHGLRIRSSGSPIVTDTIRNMGATPVVVPWAEAYSDLQQHVIDGVSVHYSAGVGAHIYEVTKYLSKTAHFQLLTGLVISNAWFEKLPRKYQKVLENASSAGGSYASKMIMAKDKVYQKELVAKGMKIISHPDIQAFKEATAKTYGELGYGNLKTQVDAELAKLQK